MSKCEELYTITVNGKKFDSIDGRSLAVKVFSNLAGYNFSSSIEKREFAGCSLTYREYLDVQEKQSGIKLAGSLRLLSGDFEGNSGTHIDSTWIPKFFGREDTDRLFGLIVSNRDIDNYIKSAARESPDQDWTVKDIHVAVYETLYVDLDLDDTSLFKELLAFFNGRQVYHKYAL